MTNGTKTTMTHVGKLCLFVVAVSVASLTRGQVLAAASPEEVVKNYMLADLEGERLITREGSLTRKAVTWEHEPGWDMVFIASSLDGASLRESSGSTARVEARISVLGIYSGESLLEVQFHEVITFVLERSGEGWKITGPIVPPHVRPKALSRHLRQLAVEEAGGHGDRSRTLTDLANSVDALAEQ